MKICLFFMFTKTIVFELFIIIYILIIFIRKMATNFYEWIQNNITDQG